MPKTRKPRKAYRPKPERFDSIQIAVENAGTLDPAQVSTAIRAVDEAFMRFKRAERPAFQFDVMADALNIAESLSKIGICSDAESMEAILRAQRTLATLAGRHQERGTWAMRAEEVLALEDGLLRHTIQLRYASRGEYERAILMTKAKLSAALRGQVSALIIAPGGRPIEPTPRAP